jgi:hypothetical protein
MKRDIIVSTTSIVLSTSLRLTYGFVEDSKLFGRSSLAVALELGLKKQEQNQARTFLVLISQFALKKQEHNINSLEIYEI